MIIESRTVGLSQSPCGSQKQADLPNEASDDHDLLPVGPYSLLSSCEVGRVHPLVWHWQSIKCPRAPSKPPYYGKTPSNEHHSDRSHNSCRGRAWVVSTYHRIRHIPLGTALRMPSETRTMLADLGWRNSKSRYRLLGGIAGMHMEYRESNPSPIHPIYILLLLLQVLQGAFKSALPCVILESRGKTSYG